MRAHLALLLVLASTSSALADSSNEISIGSYSRAMRASSANAVTSDSLGGGTLAYGRVLELGLMPGLQTWLTGGFAWGGAEGTMFSTLTTELETRAFSIGGRARYNVWRHLAVGARLDLGTSRAELKLHDGSRTLSDSGWGATTTTAASLDLLAYAGPSFKLGVRLEFGYTLTSAIELAPSEANDESTIQLDMSQASLGHLDLGGKFFAFTVLSQF